MKIVLFVGSLLFATSSHCQEESNPTTGPIGDAILANNAEVISKEFKKVEKEGDPNPEVIDLMLRTNDLGFSEYYLPINQTDYIDCPDKIKNKFDKKPKAEVQKTTYVQKSGFKLIFMAENVGDQMPALPQKLERVSGLVETQAADTFIHLNQSTSQEDFIKRLDEKLAEHGVRGWDLEKQAKFAAGVISNMPYNDDMADFLPGTWAYDQQEWEALVGTNGGSVCGGIHAVHNMIVKQINPELNAITTSYGVPGAQHVMSAVHDPNDPDKVYLANYSSVGENMLNGVSSLLDNYSSGLGNIGMRGRVWVYDGGTQKYAGTYDTEKGSIHHEVALNDDEKDGRAMYASNISQLKMNWGSIKEVSKSVRKYDKNGNLKKEKNSSKIIFRENDLIGFMAETNGVEVFGVMMKINKRVNVDKEGRVIGEGAYGRSSRTSTGVSNTNYNNNEFELQNGEEYWSNADFMSVFINHSTTHRIRILQIEPARVQLVGYAGFEIEGSATFSNAPNFAGVENDEIQYEKDFMFETGDGDLRSRVGLQLFAKPTDRTELKGRFELNNNISIDQVRYYGKPISGDGLQDIRFPMASIYSDLQLKHTLRNGDGVGGSVSSLLTPLGGRFRASGFYASKKGGTVSVHFSTPTAGFNQNLAPNMNLIPDNVRKVSARYDSPTVKMNKRGTANFSGFVQAGYSPDLPAMNLPGTNTGGPSNVFINMGARINFGTPRTVRNFRTP